MTFLEFPINCTKFEAPHFMQCYQSLWKSVGCLNVGEDWPLNISSISVDDLDLLNLRFAWLM